MSSCGLEQRTPRVLQFWEVPRISNTEVSAFLCNLFSFSPDPTAHLQAEFGPESSPEERVLISRIRDDIFLGSERDLDESLLRSHRIAGVLDLRIESKGQPLKGLAADREYKWIGIEDVTTEAEALADCVPRLETHFDEAFDFIEKRHREGLPVLVHCAMGVCRSPSIVVAYLMRHEGLTFAEAFADVHAKRAIVRPNDYFLQQLLQYEQKLREQGVITRPTPLGRLSSGL